MSECQRDRDGGEQDQATAATVTHTRARDAERRVAATTGTCANAESLAADRIADAGLAQVDPERPEVNGFAVEKAHVEEVEGQNLLIFITGDGTNRGLRSNYFKFYLSTSITSVWIYQTHFRLPRKQNPNIL